MVHEFVENEYKAFPVAIHEDMLDGLSRICDTAEVGGASLKLKWPAARPPEVRFETFKPADPGMGR